MSHDLIHRSLGVTVKVVHLDVLPQLHRPNHCELCCKFLGIKIPAGGVQTGIPVSGISRNS